MQKKLMAKFSKKFKKSYFWSIFGANFRPHISGSVTHNITWVSNTILSFRKNWCANPRNFQKEGQKNVRRTEGRTDPNSWTLPTTAGCPKTIMVIVITIATLEWRIVGEPYQKFPMVIIAVTFKHLVSGVH